MVATLTDRKKVLAMVTDNWQPTSTIARKLHMNWGVALGILGILTGDGYVEAYQVNRVKSVQFLWKRTNKKTEEEIQNG